MSERPGGLLVVDKPAGWTSHDVVARVRRLAGTRRVGHAGTLDPMATGVLVLGVERGTKLLTFLVGCDKTYTATIRLGMATVTDDAEGETTQALGVEDLAAVEHGLPEAVAALTGDIEQVPSAVSAIKVDGVRSYARVRRGDAVDLPARPVTVSRFHVDSVRPRRAAPEVGPAIDVVDVEVEVDVSSGTYVRALARDLGAALGVGGHLTALRRTRVGGIDLSAAHTLDDLAALAEAGAPGALPLLPVADAARAALPVHEVTAREATSLGYGQRIPSGPRRADAVAAIDPDGTLVAVLDETRPLARSRVVFVTAADRSGAVAQVPAPAGGPAAAGGGAAPAGV
jgi:tRNA pseudouridine55 synthase